MAKTYIPKHTVEVHQMAVYMARYQASLRSAMVAIDPDFGVLFDTLLAAVLAVDAVREVLYPLED